MDDKTLVSRFLRDGFVKLEGAVAPRVAASCARLLWQETGCDPDDPETWTQPVHWVGGMAQGPFAAAPNSPALHRAYDLLVGAGRWEPRYSPGTFPLRFPHEEEPAAPYELERVDGAYSPLEIAIRRGLEQATSVPAEKDAGSANQNAQLRQVERSSADQRPSSKIPGGGSCGEVRGHEPIDQEQKLLAVHAGLVVVNGPLSANTRLAKFSPMRRCPSGLGWSPSGSGNSAWSLSP
ncbi:hypothetical protein [Streptomyces lucensis]|uniref:hypothetical protein n=1 Tax=Streptomyces lucensis TaxID=67319 RepID=UPI003570B2F8